MVGPMFICYNNSNSCNGQCVCVCWEKTLLGLLWLFVCWNNTNWGIGINIISTLQSHIDQTSPYIFWNIDISCLGQSRGLVCVESTYYKLFWCFSLLYALLVLWLLIRKRLWVSRWWTVVLVVVHYGKRSKQEVQCRKLYLSWPPIDRRPTSWALRPALEYSEQSFGAVVRR